MPVPTRVQSGYRVAVYTPSLVLGQFPALYSLLSSCFKMTSGRAKWSNYELSHISGTQGVNAAPVSAGTKVLVPEHQVWAVPYFHMKGFAL